MAPRTMLVTLANNKTNVPKWWRRGLTDGAHCYRTKRKHYFEHYIYEAEIDMQVGDLFGPFGVIYRAAFKLAYSNAKLEQERGDKFVPRKKKRGKLG